MSLLGLFLGTAYALVQAGQWQALSDYIVLVTKILSLPNTVPPDNLGTIGDTLLTIQSDIAELTQDVAAQPTIVASVQTLIQGMVQTISDLQAQTTDPTTAAALSAAVETLKSNSAALQSAVTANVSPQPV
jgi:hypothetical protein